MYIVFGLIFLVVLSAVSGYKHCPQLQTPNVGVTIECKAPGSIKSAPCGPAEPQDTEATYRCDEYHVTPEGDYVGGLLRCGEDGRWTRSRAYQEFKCSIQCGMPSGALRSAKKFADPNGILTTRANHPWHASLFYHDPRTGNFEFWCSGSLIHPGGKGFAILSAASCLLDRDSGYPESPKNFRVILGGISSYYAENLADPKAQFFTVDDLVVNPNFKPHRNSADIGLIFLKEDVIISDEVGPVCFPNRGNQQLSKQQIQPGVVGQLVSFEDAEEDGCSRPLRAGKLPVVDGDVCRDLIQRYPSFSEFCAGQGRGPTSQQKFCVGTNGRGLYFSEHTGTPSKYYVQGVVTRDPGSKGSGKCNNYGFFTRVSSFASWVHEILDNRLDSAKMPQKQVITPPLASTTTYRITTTTPRPQTLRTTRAPIIFPSQNQPLKNFTTSTYRPRFPIRLTPTPKPRQTTRLTSATTPRPSKRTSTPPGGNDHNEITQVGLSSQNAYRAKHSAPPFDLNSTLTYEAQSWADYLIRENKKLLDRRTEFGKNLFEAKGYTQSDPEMVQIAVDKWYSTGKEYNYDDPMGSPPNQKWLSFTQLLWAGSTDIGVGVGRKGERVVVVVTYSPPGNILGEDGRFFRENVLLPLKK